MDAKFKLPHVNNKAHKTVYPPLWSLCSITTPVSLKKIIKTRFCILSRHCKIKHHFVMFVIMVSNYDITTISKQIHLFNNNHQWIVNHPYLYKTSTHLLECAWKRNLFSVCWSFILHLMPTKEIKSRHKILPECQHTKITCRNDRITTIKAYMWGKFNAYIFCSQHWITYASHGSVRTNSHHNSSCPTSNYNCSLTVKINSYIEENRQNLGETLSFQLAKRSQFTGNSALHSCLILNSIINCGKQRGAGDHKNVIAREQKVGRSLF
jgi:hypothetical protein